MTEATRRYQALARYERDELNAGKRPPAGELILAMLLADPDPDPDPDLVMLDMISRGVDTGIFEQNDRLYGEGGSAKALNRMYDQMTNPEVPT